MDTTSQHLCLHRQYSALHTVQVRAHTAEVRMEPIERESLLAHTDFCGVGMDLHGV